MKNIVEKFCNVNDIDENVFLNRKLRVPIGIPPLCLDILMNVDGLTFTECYDHKKVILWESINIPFLSKEDLITTKKIVNSSQDKADVAALLNS